MPSMELYALGAIRLLKVIKKVTIQNWIIKERSSAVNAMIC